MAPAKPNARSLGRVGAFFPAALILAVPLLVWGHTSTLSLDHHRLLLLHVTMEALTASSCFGVAALAMIGSKEARLSPALALASSILGALQLARLVAVVARPDASFPFDDGGTAVGALVLWLIGWHQRSIGMGWVVPTLAKVFAMAVIADVFMLRSRDSGAALVVGHAYQLAAFGMAFGGLVKESVRRDTHARSQMHITMQQQARRDALTGLPNRTFFLEELTQAIARTDNGRSVGVLLLDIDNFKAINDNWGHPHGDRLLVEMASALDERLPPETVVARMGGDEFAILMPDIRNARQVQDVALQVLAVARLPFQLEHCSIPVGGSVGIGVYPDDAPDGDLLMRRVDLALFHAKALGRGCARRFDVALETRSQDMLELQLLLAEALTDDQLCLHYQPQYDAAGKHICGFEALLRWQHPERGAIDPARFIPVAEASGMIVAIGEWVLDAACRQIAELRRRDLELPVAVNLSAHQLHQDGFVEYVSSMLARHQVPPSLLELELTESTMMQDPQFVATVLRELDALGVRLAIDDFGTGYSSLAYLRDFPLHRLKIDRSFVADLESSCSGMAIVQGVISLAHSLGLSVLAEGVETEFQQRILQDAGCDALQGWRFSPAVPESQVWSLLSAAQCCATGSSHTAPGESRDVGCDGTRVA